MPVLPKASGVPQVRAPILDVRLVGYHVTYEEVYLRKLSQGYATYMFIHTQYTLLVRLI